MSAARLPRRDERFAIAWDLAKLRHGQQLDRVLVRAVQLVEKVAVAIDALVLGALDVERAITLLVRSA